MSDGKQEVLHFLDYWRVIQSRKEILIAVFLLVVITGVLLTYALPKVYMASTLIRVKEQTPDLDVWNQRIMRFDPLFMRTQFRIIQSDPVIEDVVTKLGLTETLGNAYGYLQEAGDAAFEETVKLVGKCMRVQQHHDTSLIEVQIYLSELGGSQEQAPELAASIADALAVAYRNQNLQRARESTTKALKALEDAREEQREIVGALETEIAVIREKGKIDLLPQWGPDSESLEKTSIRLLEQARINVRMELEEKRAVYETVMGLTPKQLRDSAAHLSRDPALPKLIEQERIAEVDLRTLLGEGLGENHPEALRVKETITGIGQKIDDALEGLKTGVKSDYEAAQAKYDALRLELDTLKTTERTADASKYREYEQVRDRLDRAKNILDALDIRYWRESIEQKIPVTAVEIIEPAKAPPLDGPVRPNKPLNIVLSIVVGLVAGVGLAYFIEYLDTSVKTIEDIESSMDVSVLGVIPQKVMPLIDDAAQSAHAEAYRLLRTNIQFSKKLEKGKSLCVTSGSVGEGKSLTVFNLGYTCAQLGDKVLIVDSDLHRPRQHKITDTANNPGLATVLMDQAKLEDCIQTTPLDNLYLLPSGSLPSGAHGLLATQAMTDLVARLKSEYDLVLFDSPPIIGVSDASMLVRQVDAVLLVIQHRKYPRALSSRARDMIENIGGNLLGVVLNNINISRDHTYYYYQQHYYYYPRGDRSSGKRRSRTPKGAEPSSGSVT